MALLLALAPAAPALAAEEDPVVVAGQPVADDGIVEPKPADTASGTPEETPPDERRWPDHCDGYCEDGDPIPSGS